MGQTLALLARTNSPSSIIPMIKTTEGEISSDPLVINGLFTEFYSDLYKSRHCPERGEMEKFLEGTKLPVLLDTDMNSLDAPITLEELRQAIVDMPNQKSPGPDGLPVEVYKQYGEVLAPELLKTLNWSAAVGRLPSSMSEAIIVLIQKEGKDQLDASSYRPISLLGTDAKILAKVLATRLNKCISTLIHPDQSGFIQNRSTSKNIRRTYLNLQTPVENEGSRAVLSLDIAKAFDTLEWGYLWWVMERYGFGPLFINWLKILYQQPSARLKINNVYSERISLERGTRQGCPLSPLLFALAMEPFAEVVRNSPGLQGYKRKGGEERIALYADDVLLFLGAMGPSLVRAMQLVEGFGRISGLIVNWEKSTLLPILDYWLSPSGDTQF